MMRVPIKVGRDCLPSWCWSVLPTAVNPGTLIWRDPGSSVKSESDTRIWFSRHISGLTSKGTWKSTCSHRHQFADEVLLDLCRGSRPIIVDIGVSDGVTSLELIEKLSGQFEIFFATDRALDVFYVEDKGRVYFYEREGVCIVMSTRKLVVYADPAAWFPFTWIARRVLRRAPACVAPHVKQLCLIQPDLRRMSTEDPRIVLREYDIFRPWSGPAADVVKVANLLNRDYFSDEQIHVALTNIRGMVKEGGRVIVVDNPAKGLERVSVFVREGDMLRVDREINGGSHTRDIPMNL